MGKNNSRKKQDRAKAAARRAEQERRRAKAARQRQSAERYDQLSDPSASPAHIAEILAVEFPEGVLAQHHLPLTWRIPGGAFCPAVPEMTLPRTSGGGREPVAMPVNPFGQVVHYVAEAVDDGK